MLIYIYLSAASSSLVGIHFAKLLFDIERSSNKNCTLKVANRIYVRQGFPIKKGFRSMLRLYFNETLHKFYFGQRNKFVQVGTVINGKSDK